MKSYLDCFPCFMDQALRAARMVTDDENLIKEIIDSVGERFREVPMIHSPPETGAYIYGKIREITGIQDPYKERKEESIRKVLSIYPRLKALVENSEDSLLMAIRLASIGNVLDFGVSNTYDLEEELDKLEEMEYGIFHYDEFRDDLAKAGEVLFIGDNAGESVFDRLLIETLEVPVTYVVREIPVINDATLEDALNSGIGEVAKIISSGTTAPGTILKLCNEDFMKQFREADLVISKGQGNFEGLSDADRRIFFLLRAKCRVVARNLGVQENEFVFCVTSTST